MINNCISVVISFLASLFIAKPHRFDFLVYWTISREHLLLPKLTPTLTLFSLLPWLSPVWINGIIIIYRSFFLIQRFIFIYFIIIYAFFHNILKHQWFMCSFNWLSCMILKGWLIVVFVIFDGLDYDLFSFTAITAKRPFSDLFPTHLQLNYSKLIYRY